MGRADDGVVVLGGGVAGLATALLLGRDGHRVVLVDHDDPPPAGGPDTIDATWERPLIGQLRQPHNFLGRARQLLIEELPDVRRALLDVGAEEFDQTALFPGFERGSGDEHLRIVQCRRPVFDAALFAAASTEPRVTVRQGVVDDLVVDGTHVAGARLADGSELRGRLVVDALGRSTPLPERICDRGIAELVDEQADCGLLYYSRQFRFRDGVSFPPASILAGPRGGGDCFAYAVFVQDNRTFNAVVMVAATDKEFRALREPVAFTAMCDLIPVLRDWVQPDAAEPMTDVVPMGRLRNTHRAWRGPLGPGIPGLQPVGDALCHTNPTFAIGASQALEHALAVRDELRETADPVELADRVSARLDGLARARYDMVAREDDERLRWWSGEISTPFTRETAPALHLRIGVYGVAGGDAELGRAVLRRINLLDPPDALPSSERLMSRAADLVADAPAAPALPTRDDVRAALASPVG
jgi:2-polyprenyl-6-methoxyphenol hydroxylase-like FAD-dependent oxidoreductase